MSRIAFIHNALKKTDGVSLEVDKWAYVLSKIGHEIYYVAGNDNNKIHCIPELSFYHHETMSIIRNATVRLTDYSEEILEKKIYEQAQSIKGQLERFIIENNIDILIPNNLLSVGYHIPALIALTEIIRESRLRTICHNHDFYFEDSGEVEPTCRTIVDILNNYAPPSYSNVTNLVINEIARQQLFARKAIPSQVVPNVFDFDQKCWGRDEFNISFRKDMGIGENDIVFLQATRVLDRKGIELAIDIVAEVSKKEHRIRLESGPLFDGRVFSKDNKIILLCAGKIEDFGISDTYLELLKEHAKKKRVDIRFIGDRVRHSRVYGDCKIYSLWDSYAYADFVTYPSLWEGWGNQLIEAIFAKLPVAIFEYPVYISDIRTKGLEVVSLGSECKHYKNGLVYVESNILSTVANKIVELLQNKEKRNYIVEKNWDIAKANYSLDTLKNTLIELGL